MNAIDAYYATWHLGLVLFAAHLLLVGYLAFCSGFVPRWLGILIAIAGLGYLADGVGAILVAGAIVLVGLCIMMAARWPLVGLFAFARRCSTSLEHCATSFYARPMNLVGGAGPRIGGAIATPSRPTPP
jgi:hypothetical protein